CQPGAVRVILSICFLRASREKPEHLFPSAEALRIAWPPRQTAGPRNMCNWSRGKAEKHTSCPCEKPFQQPFETSDSRALFGSSSGENPIGPEFALELV